MTKETKQKIFDILFDPPAEALECIFGDPVQSVDFDIQSMSVDELFDCALSNMRYHEDVQIAGDPQSIGITSTLAEQRYYNDSELRT